MFKQGARFIRCIYVFLQCCFRRGLEAIGVSWLDCLCILHCLPVRAMVLDAEQRRQILTRVQAKRMATPSVAEKPKVVDFMEMGKKTVTQKVVKDAKADFIVNSAFSVGQCKTEALKESDAGEIKKYLIGCLGISNTITVKSSGSGHVILFKPVLSAEDFTAVQQARVGTCLWWEVPGGYACFRVIQG